MFVVWGTAIVVGGTVFVVVGTVVVVVGTVFVVVGTVFVIWGTVIVAKMLGRETENSCYLSAPFPVKDTQEKVTRDS